MSIVSKAGHIILWGAVVWLFIAGLLALQFWPHLPESAVGWAVFIGVGPPLYLLAEAASEWLWSSRAGRAVSQHPSSAVRVFLGVAFVLATGGIIWGGLWLFGEA